MTLLGNSAVIAGRNLLRLRREPSPLISSAVLPLVFFVGFFVPLHAIMAGRGVDYAQFLPPMLVVQTTLYVGLYSATLMALDVRAGMLRRTRSMPVARTAPLLGRLAADLVCAATSMVVLVGVSMVFGFRFHGGILATIGFVLLGLLFAVVLCVAYMAIAATAADPRVAAQVLEIPQFLLVLLSTGYVPADSFPSWIQPVVRDQPLTQVIEALRALAAGTWSSSIPIALVWLAVLVAVSVPVAARAFGGQR